MCLYLRTFLHNFIGVTFFILRVPRFFLGSDNIRSCSKTFRRVPSNTNTGTQRKIDLKKRICRKLIIHIDFPFLSLVLVSLNNQYIFQNVSVNAVMAQTFPLGVRNRNTGGEIQVFDPQV